MPKIKLPKKIEDYQLISTIKKSNGLGVLIVTINVDTHKTLLTTIDFTGKKTGELKQILLNEVIRCPNAYHDGYLNLYMDETSMTKKIQYRKWTDDGVIKETIIDEKEFVIINFKIANDGKTSALASFDNKICFLDIETNEQIGEIITTNFFVKSFSFNKDSTLFAYCYQDQGSGNLVLAKKENGVFSKNSLFGSGIDFDDSLTSCVAINFDDKNNCIVFVVSLETEIIAYNPATDERLWEIQVGDFYDDKNFPAMEGHKSFDYDNLFTFLTNNEYIMAEQGNLIYYGYIGRVLCLDITQKKIIKELKSELDGIILQTVLINDDTLVCVDIFGEIDIISIV
jgi:WD40 repeat protein